MSIRVGINCPYCGNKLSALSKKGFTSLHTNVGVPILNCGKCSRPIKTNHRPLHTLSLFEKAIEWIKISISSLIISILFGSMLGAFLGMVFNHFMEKQEIVNLYVVVLTIIAIMVYKINSYVKWFKRVKSHVQKNGENIDSDVYGHPDW